MNNKRPQAWRRLDNAAKIFPSTSERSDTRVFRFSCYLKEMVNQPLLQQALDQTMNRFPSFSVVMRKGFFWYYLEQRKLECKAEEECDRPCGKLYENGRKEALIRVSYYEQRINFEVYHVLCDGTGALQFLKSLVCNYLLLAHPQELSDADLADYLAPPIDVQTHDSFQKYYVKNEHRNKMKVTPAFHQRGDHREDHQLAVLEGVVSVKQVLEVAHRYNTTMTVYLTAVMIDSFRKTMYLRDQKKPVVISVPVNLRNFFPSETTGNFFGMIAIPYNFSQMPEDFDAIIHEVQQSFLRQLTKEQLMHRMNALAALEHNFGIRIAPLPFKNLILRYSRKVVDIGTTSVISNVGRIQLPHAIEPYVERFSILASTLRSQLCICSFADQLTLGFTSALDDIQPQREFFRTLAKEGIAITLYSNENEEDQDATLSEL